MPPRVPRVRTGGTAALLAAAYLLTACGPDTGPYQADTAPSVSGSDAAACERLLAGLPDELAGAVRREVEPAEAPVAAWGDPPIVLACGTDAPEEFRPGSACVRTDGVDWFTPPMQYSDQDVDATLTAMSRTPLVTVTLPAAYRPEGAAAVMSRLAGPLSEHLAPGETCL